MAMFNNQMVMLPNMLNKNDKDATGFGAQRFAQFAHIFGSWESHVLIDPDVMLQDEWEDQLEYAIAFHLIGAHRSGKDHVARLASGQGGFLECSTVVSPNDMVVTANI